jgi:biopolymer transport protein ExbD
MAKHKGADEGGCFDLNMTPMIDVIFQLLIFFMCSLHFKVLEGKLLSYLPKDKGIYNTPVTELELNEVRIRLVYDEGLDASNPMAKWRTRIYIGRDRLCKDFEEMGEVVNSSYNQMKTALNGKEPPVKLDPDKKVPCQSIVSAFDQCRKYNITRVEFAAKEAADTSDGRAITTR